MGEDGKLDFLSVKLKSILLAFWVFSVFGSNGADGSQWKLYHTSDEEFYFYDVENIIQSKDVLKVSEKSVVRKVKRYTLPEALKEIVEMEKKNPGQMSDQLRAETVDALALQETRRLYEIRCSKKMYRIITGMEYDKDGTLIDGIIGSKWQTIKPNSIIEKLYNAVCD